MMSITIDFDSHKLVCIAIEVSKRLPDDHETMQLLAGDFFAVRGAVTTGIRWLWGWRRWKDAIGRQLS
jgi:hypothetical protein